MKKFQFSLERVMEFRRTLARLEEMKLERIYAELRAIDARENALIEERAQSEKAVAAKESVTGFELALLGSFQQSVEAEITRLEKARQDCRLRIAAQMKIVTAKRRDVRLLEKLKEQRLAKWQVAMNREIDQQAEEAYLAKWARNN